MVLGGGCRLAWSGLDWGMVNTLPAFRLALQGLTCQCSPLPWPAGQWGRDAAAAAAHQPDLCQALGAAGGGVMGREGSPVCVGLPVPGRVVERRTANGLDACTL